MDTIVLTNLFQTLYFINPIRNTKIIVIKTQQNFKNCHWQYTPIAGFKTMGSKIKCSHALSQKTQRGTRDTRSSKQ